MRRRIAVFGSGGQLGAELTRVYEARGDEVAAFGHDSVDIADAAAVEQAISGYGPEIVLNAAAYNGVDLAESEPEAAYRVNALAVRHLALACRNANALLVHFSTDYVFDGLAGRPYVEEDATGPLGAYAVSKLAGEMYARAYLERALVIRTCGVYGPATVRGNFVTTMLRLANGDKPIRVVEDQVVSPTYAPALAERSAELVDRGATGLFHIGGGTPISWFEWAVKIFKAAGVTASPIPVTQSERPMPARRPQFSALSNAKMEALGIAPMPSLDDALSDYFTRASAATGRS